MLFYNYKKPVISTSICIYDGYISIYLLATIIVSVSYYVHTMQPHSESDVDVYQKTCTTHYYNWSITDMEQYAPSADTCTCLQLNIGTLP